MAFMSTQTPEETEDDLAMLASPTEFEEVIPLEERDEIIIDPVTGDIIEVSEETSIAIDSIPFGDNLISVFSDEELEEIGADLVEMVEADKESRREWYDTLKKGLKALGIYSPDDDSDTGISRISHPLLIEAATQFQARAMAELLPPGGPVKTTIIGERSEESVAQAQRVEDYMNYQLTVEDRSYYDERDQMLYLLPFSGSEFDKQYADPTTGKVVSRWVRHDHFIVPYNTSSLETAERYTHELHLSHSQFRRFAASGFYSTDMDDVTTDEEMVDDEDAPLTETLTELDGQEKPIKSRKEHVLYEVHIDYDLPGFEDDIALPYVITVDAKTKEVKSIYRNWKELDDNKQKRIWFTHKKFLPGFGFYGFGLLHCIGNLGEAATEILRILLDSGAFATLQGGFKSKDAKLPGDVQLEPGVWMDTEMTAEELARSFYTPPFKEPSQVLLSLLGTVVELGQRFAATTETMVGDAATTGPVGTMVAQIEQGSKVFSGIHKRLHKAFGDEFLHIAELNGEHLPDVYPYIPTDGMRNVLRQDFDGRVDVIPVSDPNIFSAAQRIAMAQVALQLAQSMPDIADRRFAAVSLLKSMRFPDAEKVFPEKADAQRVDPVTEASLYLMGRPIKAFLEQNHQAHLQVHMAQVQQLPEDRRAAFGAHIAEHMAMAQFVQMNMMLQQQGIQLPPVNWGAKPTESPAQEIPPELEQQIAMAAAQTLQQAQQEEQARQQAQQAQQQPQQNPAAEEQAKEMAFQNEERRKQLAFDADQARKNQALAQEVDREDAKEGISPTLVKQAAVFIEQTGIQMSPRELAVMSKALGKPFNEVVAAVARLTMQGQGGSQFQQTAEVAGNNPRFM